MPNRIKALTLAILVGLSGTAAAGLGNIKVYSHLGEPFYAVIPLTGQTARNAANPANSTQDELSQINVQGSYASGKLDFRIVRKKGQTYVQVKSFNPINEPVLTFGVRVNSNSGTVSRQYSAMLDPRDYEYSVGARKTTQVTSSQLAPDYTPPKTRVSTRATRVGGSDTLTSIAARNKPARLSLASTKRAIFLANRKAFVRGNPNRIIQGATITVPSEARMRALLAADRKVQVKYATSSTKDNSASGPIVNPVGPVTPTNDKELAALKAQLKEAQDRNKLLQEELNKATQKPDKPIKENKPVTPPEEDNKPVINSEEENKPVINSEEENKPVITSEETEPLGITSEEIASTPVVDAEQEAAEKARKEEEKKKFIEKQRLEDEERKRLEDEANKGILDILFEDPTLLAMGGGGLLLIVGALVLIIRRRKAKAASVNDDYEEAGDTFFSVDSGDLPGGNLPSGVTGVPASNNVKPAAAPKQQPKAKNAPKGNSNTIQITPPAAAEDSKASSTFMSDFTRMSAAIDSVEIDPLSEAEVYIAYGRTDEAEEILKDALAKDPAQHEVRKKLLEIYAGKQEIDSFTAMAKELYDAFDGRGALWQEVCVMGRQLDPNNPLYGNNAATSQQPATAPAPSRAMQMDISAAPQAAPTEQEDEIDLDMDFSADDFSAATLQEHSFDFSPETPSISADSSVQPETHPSAQDSLHELEFDLDAVLNDAKNNGSLNDAIPEIEAFDLGNSDESLSLDNSSSLEFNSDPAAAKLELARVYLDMGDADGAREALEEFLDEAENPALRAEAEEMLKKINS